MKKALSIIIALSILAASVFPVYAGILGKDGYLVTGSREAELLWEQGLFLGSDGTFRLDEPLTRLEAAVMLTRLLGAENDARAQQNAHPFSDVPDWANIYVGYLYQNKLSQGISDKEYGAADNVTVNQYFTLMLRALGYSDGIDFSWDSAAQAAVSLEIVTPCECDDFVAESRFMRNSAVIISYAVLYSQKKGTDTTLLETISLPGKPMGEMPVATLFAKDPPAEGSGGQGGQGGQTGQSSGAAYISTIGGFSLLGDTTIMIKVTCTASGSVTVKASSGSSSAEVTADMVSGKVYTINFEVGADAMGALSGGGSVSMVNQTITFTTSSGSTQSKSVFGVKPTIKSAQVTDVD